MSKKKLDVMAKERQIFIHGQTDENGNIVVPGCVRNGIDEESANKIFDEMSEFAKYAFNKSHAAAYSVVSYRTAYLKAHYPTEFMAALLNSFLGNLTKVPEYIEECKRLNIEILKPDINHSFAKFTVDNRKIRFGMATVKNVGINVINLITKEREKNGQFKDFTNFCERMQEETVNKKCIESLIKAGAFDNMGKTRATLLASFENIISTIQSINRKSLKGQVSMFDMPTEVIKEDTKYNYTELTELLQRELLSMEKEMLGIYISGHPLDNIRENIEKITNANSLKLHADEETLGEKQFKDGQKVIICGIVSGKKIKSTRNNDMMAFVELEDLYGSIEVIAFPRTLKQFSFLLVQENIVIVEGRLSIREDEETKIIAENIKVFNQNEKKEKTLKIYLSEESQLNKAKAFLNFFSGERDNVKVKVYIQNEEKISTSIYLTKDILDELKEEFFNCVSLE